MPTVVLPTAHEDQVRAYAARSRFFAIRCGRRWGKTEYAVIDGGNAAAQGFPIGFFAPDYKIITPAYKRFKTVLEPIERSSSQMKGEIVTTSRRSATVIGGVDFWTLNNDRAGRSRFYKKVFIDEAAFTGPEMIDMWEKSIKPTLLDLGGSCVVMSNTNGVDADNFMWQICNDPKHGFTQFHAPTWNDPMMPRDEIERLRLTTHPLVFAQEYGAEFIDWSGVAFFSRDDLLVNGAPVEYPVRCDLVFAVIDTAVKTGQEHDATAVSYWAFTRHGGHPLVCLDWDLVQIEGSLLETWLPNVFRRLEELCRVIRVRSGSAGAFIEDAQSGTILLQQAMRRGLDAKPIESKLTALGKDARAINVSGYVYQGSVKFSRHAYDRTVNFKGQDRNHMLSQVLGFRVGDKNAATRADDLADTFTYAIALALGDSGGF